ncbi:MAG: SDR family NAD(P)-dependent oxidoreductase, partial [bacterium]
MKKVLVTGGAGFIGSHVVDEYLEQGWKVVVVDDLSSGKKENLNEKAKFYQMDITDERLDEIFAEEKLNLVNHHAAQIDVRVSVKKPMFDAQVNILGTLNLLNNCIKHRVNDFVFISSGGVVYGEPTDLPVHEHYPKNPLSPYGVSKHTIEHYLHYYSKTYGLNYLSLRYGNVYGPRQDPYGEAGVIAIFTQQMLQGKRPKIFGDGEQLRDYVYVSEVVNINLLASQQIESLNERKPSSPDDLAYNVGTGKGNSVNLLYRLLANITGFKTQPTYALERKGEIRRIYLNTNKAKKELGWQCQLSLREGLEKTVDWF